MPENPAASSRPKYPVPWIATYFLAAIVLIAGAFGAHWFVNRPGSESDYADPDMQFLEGIVLSSDPRTGDFSDLNGGDWQALCLVGWNGDLDPALKSAAVPAAVESTIRSAYASRREIVNQTEFMLVYVTGEGSVTALRHPHGFAFAREGAAMCTAREAPILTIPATVK